MNVIFFGEVISELDEPIFLEKSRKRSASAFVWKVVEVE